MKPRFHVYIVSKGRHESRLTSRVLESMKVKYTIIIEEQEYENYCNVIDKSKIAVLDKSYQRDYDTFDDLGESKSKGPGPARNYAWDLSVAKGDDFHWVMDDNIKAFYRWNKNLKVPVGDATIFRCMEDFVLRYQNVAMAGPNYFMFASRKSKAPPFVLNTRIYSCNLIRNDTKFRWRGRYNEDTDLSIRMMKAGWCTILFNAFLQEKITTQVMTGGNTKEFYQKEGTLPKSRMLVSMHPDISKIAWRFGRWHHHVDYTQFKTVKLIAKSRSKIVAGVDDYGMKLIRVPTKRAQQERAKNSLPT